MEIKQTKNWNIKTSIKIHLLRYKQFEARQRIELSLSIIYYLASSKQTSIIYNLINNSIEIYTNFAFVLTPTIYYSKVFHEYILKCFKTSIFLKFILSLQNDFELFVNAFLKWC